MGAGWFVACEESGRVALPHGGRALLFAQYHLEEFAYELGLSPLKDFFSSNPEAIAEYFRSQGLNPDQFSLPDEEWFDPNEALPTLRGLLAKLNDDPGPVQSLEKVRDDLATICAAVEAADARGERFHIGTAMPDLSGREPGEK
ncbi:MAG: hypothetical protein ACJ8C4_03430 [Gemmataceae bacterium]